MAPILGKRRAAAGRAAGICEKAGAAWRRAIEIINRPRKKLGGEVQTGPGEVSIDILARAKNDPQYRREKLRQRGICAPKNKRDAPDGKEKPIFGIVSENLCDKRIFREKAAAPSRL